MGSRPKAIVGIQVVIGAILVATPGPVLALSYTYDCDAGSTPQYHMYVHLETSNSSTEFDGSQGEAFVRSMSSCYSPSTKSGFSAVLPANLQENLTGGGLVQVGFLRTSEGSATEAVYTAKDHATAVAPAGSLSVANWYHGGALDLGDLYRFRIRQWYGALNVPEWQICIRDVTDGESFVCTTIDRTWGLAKYARLVWWTYETENSSDAMGQTNAGAIRLRWLQYRRENGDSWFVRLNMGEGAPPYDYNVQGGCRHDPHPSYYSCVITNEIDHDGDGNLDDSDALKAWTTLH